MPKWDAFPFTARLTNSHVMAPISIRSEGKGGREGVVCLLGKGEVFFLPLVLFLLTVIFRYYCILYHSIMMNSRLRNFPSLMTRPGWKVPSTQPSNGSKEGSKEEYEEKQKELEAIAKWSFFL